jgi:hypothetical protein
MKKSGGKKMGREKDFSLDGGFKKCRVDACFAMLQKKNLMETYYSTK